MTKNDLRQIIQTRELTIREVFSGTMVLLEQNIRHYFLLAILIFLPSNLVTEIYTSQLPETLTMAEYTRFYGVQLLLNLYGMIALCVTAIMAQNQLQRDEEEPFGISFYRGIRCWPRFIITALLFAVVLFAIFACLTYVALLLPILMVPAVTFVVIIIMIATVYLYNICITATLRRYTLARNIHYVRSVMKDHVGKSIGIILLLSLVSVLITLPVVSLVDLLMTMVGIPVLGIVVNTLVGSVVSIVNIFTNLGAVLYFINLELMKQKK